MPFYVILLIVLAGCRPVDEAIETGLVDRSGPYLGETPPASGPERFADGLISTDLNERDAAFTPDGTRFYYTLMAGISGTIIEVRQVDGRWMAPEIASFSGVYSDLEPFVARDGQRLYFASNRPLEGNREVKDYDIWYVDRVGEGWGSPVNIGAPVNTASNEFYPSLTRGGVLYFTARREDSVGGEDLYRAAPSGNGFAPPERLPNTINTEFDEFNALVDPDERFLLFSSFGRPDGIGGGDLYISARRGEEGWQAARNLGDAINSPELDYSPALSPDGRYIFFSSRRTDPALAEKSSLSRFVAQLHSPGNGAGDLYWSPIETFVHTP